MTDEDQSSLRILYGVIGGLVAFAIVLIIIARIISVATEEQGISPRQKQRIAERIEPVGEVYTGDQAPAPQPAEPEQQTAAAEPASGKAVYDQLCSTCHAAGVAGAPRLGDTAAWQSRLDQRGRQGLYENSINGFKAMPPKGGDPSLSDREVKNAVDYMLEEAGLE